MLSRVTPEESGSQRRHAYASWQVGIGVRANDEFVVLLDVTDVSLSVCNWSNSVVHDICLLGARFCRHHANTFGVNTQHLLCDQLCVDFVCRFLFFMCIYMVFCVTGKPTEHLPSMCIRIVVWTFIRRTTVHMCDSNGEIRVPHTMRQSAMEKR